MYPQSSSRDILAFLLADFRPVFVLAGKYHAVPPTEELKELLESYVSYKRVLQNS
jgi:hypothetical protein